VPVHLEELAGSRVVAGFPCLLDRVCARRFLLQWWDFFIFSKAVESLFGKGGKQVTDCDLLNRPAPGGPFAPEHFRPLPARSAPTGFTVAARGFTVAARGFTVAARGFTVAARGFTVAARGFELSVRTGAFRCKAHVCRIWKQKSFVTGLAPIRSPASKPEKDALQETSSVRTPHITAATSRAKSLSHKFTLRAERAL